MADRAGSPPRAWQRMLSGRRLDLIDPSPLDVEIIDIAHGLARVARWNGQTTGEHAFSVAEHCLIVEDIAGLLEPTLTPAQRLVVLLHDGPEYVIGDMISPFKAVMGGEYKVIEKRLEIAIHRRFGLETVATERLHPGLKRLLDVRRTIGLRNSAHSLVKLMNPVAGPALVVGSYTHPEYAESMAATFRLMRTPALLLRGTEGEPVADPRRTPTMQAFVNGQTFTLQEHQAGPLTSLPNLPTQLDAATTAAYIQQVMTGAQPVPAPIAQQVAHILQLVESL